MSKRTLTGAALLLFLTWLNGCSKASKQASNDANSSIATSASQAGNHSPVSDDLPEGQTASSTAPAAAVLPAGTSITVRLQQGLSSASATPGERFEAVLEEPLVAGDKVVVPTGTLVEGHVVLAHHSGRLHHPGELAVTLDSMIVNQRRIPLATSQMVARGSSHKRRNWGWIGGGTGGGAVIGALAAGGEGALIGSGIGAAAGTTTAFLSGKKNVTLSSERILHFRLHQEVDLS